jgi:5'-nucleotidase (lipoprotein e(P4) family)
MKNILLISLLIFSCFGFADELQNEELIFSVLWQKTSAEYRALAYQAYNLAEMRLKETLSKPSSKPLAVVVDLDETVLDNSDFEALVILEGKNYYNDFMEWVESGEAKTVPGSKGFLDLAHDSQVEVFYISNRDEKFRDGTLKLLQKLELPNADNEHILLRDGNSDKQPRRDLVALKYEIVLFIGDNLIDFTDVFRKKTIEERFTSVDSLQAEFGKKFIILPNPMYGEWEKTIYGGTRKIPDEQKEDLRIKALQK